MSAVLIDKPWGVSAFGAASVRAVPDLARIQVSVIRTEPTPEAAFATTADAVSAVREAMRGLRVRARQDAVEAARRKAQLYADAAGVRLGAVVHIEDVDPERLRQEYRGHGSGGGGGDDLAPGYVSVSAAVTLGFSIAH